MGLRPWRPRFPAVLASVRPVGPAFHDDRLPLHADGTIARDDLNLTARDTARELVGWLEARYELDFGAAYTLASIADELRIARLVKGPSADRDGRAAPRRVRRSAGGPPRSRLSLDEPMELTGARSNPQRRLMSFEGPLCKWTCGQRRCLLHQRRAGELVPSAWRRLGSCSEREREGVVRSGFSRGGWGVRRFAQVGLCARAVGSFWQSQAPRLPGEPEAGDGARSTGLCVGC